MRNGGGKSHDFVTKVVFVGVAMLVSVAGFASSTLYTGIAERVRKLEDFEREERFKVSDALARLKVSEGRAVENERELKRRETRITRLEARLESLTDLVQRIRREQQNRTNRVYRGEDIPRQP